MRKEMVRVQLRARGIKDKRVLMAMGKVVREKFVAKKLRKQAYEDRPLPIGEGQTISQPYVVAWMCEKLKLFGKERVLDIGIGSGYQAAILSLLTKEVVGVEIKERLAKKARRRLRRLGFNNVEVITGDGRLGYVLKAPYDGIIAAASSSEVPIKWIEQLKPGGRIVMPKEDKGRQRLMVATKVGKGLVKRYYGEVVFVPLID